ncbi:RHS repeat domain-containing protein [Bacillota bacterium Meth-B3]
MRGMCIAPNNYTKVRISVVYMKNINKANFTNIFLHREAYGQTFTYDADGKKNVTAVQDLALQKSGMTYDGHNNMTSYRQPGRPETVKHTMTYGDATDQKKHLLESHTTPMKVHRAYKYDEYGNVKEEKLAEAGKVGAANTTINARRSYQHSGNYLEQVQDARGEYASQVIDPDAGTVQSTTDPTWTTTYYGYDASKRLTSVETQVGEIEGSTDHRKLYRNEYTYTDDRLNTVSHNTAFTEGAEGELLPAGQVTYAFEYDDLGNQTQVKVGAQTLSTNVYGDDRSRLLKQANYGNGQAVHYAHDAFDRLTEVRYGSDPDQRYRYEYGANGQVARVHDDRLGRTHWTEYDQAQRPSETHNYENGAPIYRTKLTYDKFNNLSRFTERMGAESVLRSSSYSYDNDNRTTEVKYGDGTRKVAYTYDKLGRVQKRTATNGMAYETNYAYLPGDTALYGSGASTALVSQISQSHLYDAMDFSYTYDERGNITSETRSGVTDPTEYGYDAIGQLNYVSDPREDAIWEYDYDCGGNITGKRKYARLPGGSSGALLETIPYAYDATWRDKLSSYGGKSITYDAIGNPLSYDGWAFTWQAGRQLQRMQHAAKQVEFAYDANGLRVQKKVTEGATVTTTDYTLHGKLLMHLKNTTTVGGVQQGDPEQLHFFYDKDSRPAMVEYNGTTYTYIHNLQGDIVSICNEYGNMVEYTYDAWGRPTGMTGVLKDTLGRLNPFRYRGYIWDGETGLYYLRTRYYNPEWGRFINADSQVGEEGELLGHSVFAYCVNNPVSATDPDGQYAVFGLTEAILPPPSMPFPTLPQGIPLPTLPQGISIPAIPALPSMPPIPLAIFSDAEPMPSIREVLEELERPMYLKRLSRGEFERIARRYFFPSRKAAEEAARRAGGGRPPRLDPPHGKKPYPHYHPGVENKVRRTPHMATNHDHYYFSKSQFGFLMILWNDFTVGNPHI